ncbi:MAG: Trm112 family protein [Candidatus Aminicenantes bacterium]|nr:Trm112 family protein [Candidatus Aminicenantes bacterium]
MAIDPRLLEILACPVCKGDIKLTLDEQGLKCIECARVYPIEDDIPVMLGDEATIEPEREIKD